MSRAPLVKLSYAKSALYKTPRHLRLWVGSNHVVVSSGLYVFSFL